MASKFKAPLIHQFQQGQKDFKRGKITSPYRLGSDRDKEWQRGFNDAYFENLEKSTWTSARKSG